MIYPFATVFLYKDITTRVFKSMNNKTFYFVEQKTSFYCFISVSLLSYKYVNIEICLVKTGGTSINIFLTELKFV